MLPLLRAVRGRGEVLNLADLLTAKELTLRKKHKQGFAVEDDEAKAVI